MVEGLCPTTNRSIPARSSDDVFARLGCLFIVVPLLELALLIQMGRWVGVLPTVALVALTGLLGAALVRSEGGRTLAKVQMELGQGRVPGRALMDGACLLVGGALLLTPGVITDLLAFALLVPPSRRRIQARVRRRFERAIAEGSMHVQMGGIRMGGFPGGTSPGQHDPDEDDPPRRRGEIIQE
jgi:UPF0716 protein FxsA